MKYWLPLALLLLTTPALAQEDVYGFWGIPFYKTKGETIDKVATDRYLAYADKGNHVVYANAEYAGSKADVYLLFNNDTFYAAAAKMRYDYTEHLMPAWNAWKDKMMVKYGAPKVTNELLPDYVTDLQDMNKVEKALKDGEVKYECIWYLNYYDKKHSLITILRIEDARHISLTMTDAHTQARLRKSKKIARPDDY